MKKYSVEARNHRMFICAKQSSLSAKEVPVRLTCTRDDFLASDVEVYIT